MLGGNINCYVCNCAEAVWSTDVADCIQSGWITCGMVKDIIKMGIKVMVLMTSRSKLIW